MSSTHYEHAREPIPEILSCLGQTPTGRLLRQKLESRGVELPAFVGTEQTSSAPTEAIEIIDSESAPRRPGSHIDLLLEAASL